MNDRVREEKEMIHGSLIRVLREDLGKLGTAEGFVPKEVARGFIRSSAWWLTHASGPVRAPGHSRRIYGSESNWRIDFGANTFCVGEAISRCRRTISRFLDKSTPENFGSLEELKGNLLFDIHGSVENYAGEEYYYGNRHDGEMIFGAQSINTSDFIRELFSIVRVQIGYKLLETSYKEAEAVYGEAEELSYDVSLEDLPRR